MVDKKAMIEYLTVCIDIDIATQNMEWVFNMHAKKSLPIC